MKASKFSYIRSFLFLFLIANSYSIMNKKKNENKKIFSFTVDISEYDLSKDKIKIKENEGLIDDKEAFVIDSTFYEDKNKMSRYNFLSENNYDIDKSSLWTDRLAVPEYFKNSISGFEKFVYENLFNIFKQKYIPSLSFKFTNVEKQNVHASNFMERLNHGIFILREDHTEVWFLDSYDAIYEKNNDDIVKEFTVKIIRAKTLSEFNALNQKVRDAALNLANAANEKPTMYEKLLYIRDYLGQNTYYDWSNKNPNNCYGGLIEHRVVCDGISKSFALVSRLVGAETLLVAGNGHAWNFVRLDNKWYAIDVTWSYFLIGSDTSIGDKRYKDDPLRNLDNNEIPLPKLYTTEYEPPNIDPEANLGYKDCKKRLKEELEISNSKQFDMKEVFHSVCAPSLKNKCRYHFGEPDSDNYKN